MEPQGTIFIPITYENDGDDSENEHAVRLSSCVVGLQSPKLCLLDTGLLLSQIQKSVDLKQ